MYYNWRFPLWKVLPFTLLLIVDGTYLAANVVKIANGGYVSVIFGLCFGSVMTSWWIGEQSLSQFYNTHVQKMKVKELQQHLKRGGSLLNLLPKTPENYVVEMREGLDTTDVDLPEVEVKLPETIQRLPGMGVFLSSNKKKTPSVFQTMLNRVHGAPEIVVFMNVVSENIPFVADDQKTTVKNYGENIYRVTVRNGYAENKIKLHHVIADPLTHGLPKFSPQFITYYVNRDRVSIEPGFYLKRFPLFLYLHLKRTFYGIPGNIAVPFTSVIELGMQTPLGR